MDPLSHLIVARALLGTDRAVLVMAVLPDLPFYSTYPLWVARYGLLPTVLEHGIWPEPPRWIVLLHRLSHAIPVALLIAWALSHVIRHPVQRILASWLLHILVDIPSHARDPWGPRPLWPFSDCAVDGYGWAEHVSFHLSKIIRRAS